MSMSSEHAAAGILAAGCYFCGELINLREGWVEAGQDDYAHPECAYAAQEFRMAVDAERDEEAQ